MNRENRSLFELQNKTKIISNLYASPYTYLLSGKLKNMKTKNHNLSQYYDLGHLKPVYKTSSYNEN